jgi:hypothetical protein
VTGNLYIAAAVDISWPNLQSVGGILEVINAKLSSLSVPNLSSVGAVDVVSSSNLSSLTGLRGITTVTNGWAQFSGNAALPECEIERFFDQVHILKNPILVTNNKPECQPLPADCASQGLQCAKDCSQPSGYLCLSLRAGDVDIRNQSDLDAVSASENIAGDLHIQTPNLTALPWSKLTRVYGNVVIESSASLTSLLGLSGLRYIGGRLYVYNNLSLADVALPSLTQIQGDLKLSGNPQLTTPAGLGALATVGGNVDLTGTALSTIVMPSLTKIGGDLTVDSNSGLFTIADLRKLTTVNGTLEIASNGVLTNIDGLSKLTTVGQDLAIRYDEKLSSVGLSSVTIIGGTLSAYGLPQLGSLNGLGNVTTIGGTLDVEGDDVLSTLGLGNLTSVKGNLLLSNNKLLAGFALSRLGAVGGDFTITGNANLAPCTAQALADQIRLAHIGGIVTINNNSGTCN